MVYTSRAYERNWTYDHAGTNFDARVGRILSSGLDLQTSLRSKALQELATSQELEAAAANRSSKVTPTGPGLGTMRLPEVRRPSGPVDTRGYVWVDSRGQNLGPVGEGPLGVGEKPMSGRRQTLLTAQQQAYVAMSAPDRSMQLWKRLNPGCVAENTKLPRSTFKDHFGPKADAEEADVLDRAYFFKKTEFSEYTEVKLRLMNHLK